MITLADLVKSGSVSPDGAAVLRAIGTGRHSFLVYALPRNAGKTTVATAILAAVPDVPRTEFFGGEDERIALSGATGRGYLVVRELGHRGQPGYLAGEQVPRVFRLVAGGYSLASSLHADSVAEVFDVLGRNGVAPDTATAVEYLVKVRALGDPMDLSTRRVVEAVDVVTGVHDGRPVSARRYEWDGK